MLHFWSQIILFFQCCRYVHLCLFDCYSCFVLHPFRTQFLEFSFFFHIPLTLLRTHGVALCVAFVALLFQCCSSHCSLRVAIIIALLFFTCYYSSNNANPRMLLFLSRCHSFYVVALYVVHFKLQFVHCSSRAIPLVLLLPRHSFHDVLPILLLSHYSFRITPCTLQLPCCFSRTFLVRYNSCTTRRALPFLSYNYNSSSHMMQHLSHNHSSHTTFLKYLVFVAIFMISLLFLSHCCSFVLLG